MNFVYVFLSGFAVGATSLFFYAAGLKDKLVELRQELTNLYFQADSTLNHAETNAQDAVKAGLVALKRDINDLFKKL